MLVLMYILYLLLLLLCILCHYALCSSVHGGGSSQDLKELQDMMKSDIDKDEKL